MKKIHGYDLKGILIRLSELQIEELMIMSSISQ